MVSRRYVYLFSMAIIILMLGLSACVRPVPGAGDDDATATPVSPDANVGGGTDGGETAPETGGGETAPETGGEEGGETAPETGGETAPETGGEEGGETAPETGGETAPETGGEEGGETAPETGGEQGGETAPPATGGQPTQGGGTIGTPPTTEVIHTVQPGENLFRIGLQYGYSWVVLARYNGIPNPNYIYVGQQIRIPAAGGGGGGGQPPTDGNYTYYVVQPGDNLFRIGLKFGMSWVFIAEANGLTNPNYLVPGQVLKIPVVPTPYGS